VTALPEDPAVLRRTQAEEDAARGAQLRKERRNWPTNTPDTKAPVAASPNLTRSPAIVSDATRVETKQPFGQPTIKSRDEFEEGSEANSDRLLGMSDRLERAAPYRSANEKAKLLSVGRRLGEEANILNRRPSVAGDVVMGAANMATLGLPEIAGVDRSGSVEREKAARLAANTAVTPDELRETGAIGEDDLVPRTLGTDTPSVGRQLGKMAGGFAGLMLPLSAEKAIVGGVLRNVGVRGAKGITRVDRVVKGIEREQRYLNPRTGLGKSVRDATEFAVPGALYDANSARANNEDVGERVKSGLLTNVTAGVGLPRVFEGIGKGAKAVKPGMAKLREFAGEAKQAISDSRVPERTGKYDYSSTQLDLPEQSATAVRDLSRKIPDEDLAEKGRVGEIGTSEGPHVTVKYGLHDNDPSKVKELLADEKPITVRMGKTSIFENGESGNGDVVKVDVDSPELRALNKKISDALDHTDTHPDYNPHVTVAYVKPGKGAKYAGDASLEGHVVTIDKLTFSGADGSLHEIPLGKKKPAIDRLREFAAPHVADALSLPVGRAALTGAAALKAIDENPKVRKAALTAAAAYSAGNMKGLNEDGADSPAALAALAAGTLATHGHVSAEEALRMYRIGQISHEEARALGAKLKPAEAPVFFSRVERHLQKTDFANSKPKTVAEWEKFFSKGGDFSPKEIKMRLGEQFENAREEGRSLTKAEVQAMLADNPVHVKAHVLGSPQLQGRVPDKTGEPVLRDANGYENTGLDGRYGQTWTEPGGEDYREIVITARPTKRYRLPEGFDVQEVQPHGMDAPRYIVNGPEFQSDRGFVTRKEAIDDALERLRNDVKYDEKHYGSANEGIENVIGQVRLKTRTDADGKKVLFIEEAQSQAGQDKAAKGYRDDPKIRELDEGLKAEFFRLSDEKRSLRSQVNELTARINDPYFAESRKANAQTKKQLMSRLDDIEHEMNDIAEKRGELDQLNLPPSGLPLIDDMSEYNNVLLRHVLDIAAREGHDKIAWTTGEMQGKRYTSHLQKQADRLMYNPESKTLRAFNGTELVLEKSVTPERLADYVGKDNASKMLGQPKKKWRDELVHQLKGDDFTVGDSGMKNYYDRVVPAWFEKEARKLGLQIEVKPMALPDATRRKHADDVIVGSRSKPLDTDALPATDAFRKAGVLADYPEDVRSVDARLARDVWQAGKDEWERMRENTGGDLNKLNDYARQAMVDKIKEMSPDERQRLGRLLNTDLSDAAVYGDFTPHDLDAPGLEFMIAQSGIETTTTAYRAAQTALKYMRRGDDFQTAMSKLKPEDRRRVANVVASDLYSPSGDVLRPGDAPIVQSFDVPRELPERIFAGQALYANPFLNPVLIAKMAKAHPTIFRGAAIAGAGYGIERAGEATDNERLKWSGMGIISLGALHALGAHPVNGKPLYKTAAEFAGKKIVAGMKDEKFGPLKGKDILNWISYDILATPELRQAADEYERDVAKGAARAAEFAAKMRRLGPIGERYATDLITQEQWEKQAATLTPDELKKVVAAAQALMNEFHDLGELEVKYGTLARGQFDRYDGQYVPYLYALHEADAARGVGGGPLPTMKPKTREHKTRGDIPRTSRENMGQIRESGYLAEQGIEKGYRNVAAAKLFSALSSMPGALHPDYEQAVKDLIAAQQSSRTGRIKAAKKKLERIRNDAKGGYDRGQLAGYKTLTNAKGYGVLAGAVVRKDIAEYLEGLPHFGEKNIANDLFQQWKKIHTVFNPGTHLGNFVSNITTVHMKGLPLHEQPAALRDAYREIKAYQDTGRGRHARALTEAGVMDRNVATMDYSGNTLPSVRSRVGKLRDLANRTTRETRQVLAQREIDPTGPQPGQSLPHAMAAAAAEEGGKLSDKLAKYYNLEDNVFRVALLKKVTKPANAGGLGLNMEQGVEYVRHHMGDFRTRSKALSLARWYSPFIMYPAKMLPHMVGSIVEHPTRWMTLAAGWGIVDQIGAYASGEGDLRDVRKRIKTGQIDTMDMQEDQRPSRGFGYVVPGPLQAPIKRGKNRFAVDISRWTPFSALSGQPSPGSMAAAVSSRIPAIVSPGGPLSDIFARTQVNADPYTGEEWINPSDAPGKKAAKMVGGLVANQVLPSALAWHLPRFMGDVADKRGDKAVIDAFGFAGARPRTIIPGQRLQQDEYWRQDEREAATRALNKRMRETHDPARRQQAKDEYTDRLDRIEREFKRRNTRPK
jgi:2'-5' RNA ligase